jgi:hypothetical protein
VPLGGLRFITKAKGQKHFHSFIHFPNPNIHFTWLAIIATIIRPTMRIAANILLFFDGICSLLAKFSFDRFVWLVKVI